jgi:hypothetical protein
MWVGSLIIILHGELNYEKFIFGGLDVGRFIFGWLFIYVFFTSANTNTCTCSNV